MRCRVLVITSSYAPAMIADMHRARHLAWELPKLGWDVEILCPDGSYQQPSCMDRDSAAFFAPNTPTHLAPQWCRTLFKTLGFGSIGWRALIPMLYKGTRVLRGRRFDLVYFSTTQFSLFLLGPAWRRWLDVPFVLDFHDPCYKEGSAKPVWAQRSFKHVISGWLAKHIESHATKAATGLVAVSPAYIQTLSRRYADMRPAWLSLGRHAAIPFAVLQRDFEHAHMNDVSAGKSTSRPSRIVYVGAGGPIMLRSFSLVCRALAHLRQHDSEMREGIQIELYGTMLGWLDGDPRHLAELAIEHDVADLIREDPRRVSYRRSVQLLLESHGVLILGVDDTGYMPSKLFSYALSGKPLLAVLHRDSPGFEQFRGTPQLGHALWFDRTGDMPVPEAAAVMRVYLGEVAARRNFDRQAILEPFLAPAMAFRHAELFDACVRPTV